MAVNNELGNEKIDIIEWSDDRGAVYCECIFARQSGAR